MFASWQSEAPGYRLRLSFSSWQYSHSQSASITHLLLSLTSSPLPPLTRLLKAASKAREPSSHIKAVMVSVASLLNPLPMDLETSKGLTTPYTDRYNSTEYFTPPPELPPPPQKNAKMVKDAAVFAKGKIKGEVRYPAFEVIKDEASCREMSKFRIYPLGRIQEFPRHIPYNSDKKGFLEKTGRESFEGLSPSS